MNGSLPKKSLGQHWLGDDASLEAMCQAAQIKAGDMVLEIGPGQGALTEFLLAHGAKVLALEFDEALLPVLEQNFGADPNFTLQEGDVRMYNLTTLPTDYKIVANIPYYLTSYLLRLLADTSHKPSAVALLVQKEVAQRVAANPGHLSVIAVAVQLQYEVTLGQVVPARLFTPAPKVDSQILILTRQIGPLFPDVVVKDMIHIVKVGFTQPRKTLLNNLSNGLKISREATETLLSQAGLDLQLRAQALSLDNWHDLSVAVSAINVVH